MAIYHLSIKIISRGKGKSAVAAAAYRAGVHIKNDYDGVIHDYTLKGGVVHTEILLPDHAPSEYADRSALWNAVERIEKVKNSQLAREIEIALPVELTKEQNIALAHDYVQQNFVEQGMCADICIHDKNDGNPHAHIMLTMRPLEPDGSWGAKSKKEYFLDENGEKILLPSGIFKTRKIEVTNWNDQTKAEEWRAAWTECVNTFLERANHTERIDHRSFARQGKDELPTIHLGAAAYQMEKRGIATERGNLNRSIEVSNQQLRQLKARIAKLQAWLNEKVTNTEQPILTDVISNIFSQRAQAGKSDRYQSISNLKAASEMLNFLQENNITDIAGLDEKVKSMYEQQYGIRDKLKPVERRLKTLDEHIRQADVYLQYKAVYTLYQQQKPKNQVTFAETHRAEITLFESASRYLKDVMNGKTTLPIKAWRAELDKLTAEKNCLVQAYVSLKAEAREVEQIRRGIYELIRYETRRAQLTRTQDMGKSFLE